MQSWKKNESGSMSDPANPNNQALKAVFLDRDGVLNEDSGYVSRVQDVKICEGVFEGLRILRDAGFLLIVITNQSGIARGYYNESDVWAVHDYMTELFKEHGTKVDLWLHCPHHPDGEVEPFILDCDCRKPAIGLIQQALKKFPGISLKKSFLIGDKISDIDCGKNAGIHAIQIVSAGIYPRHKTPDHTAQDFLEAVRYIVNRDKERDDDRPIHHPC